MAAKGCCTRCGRGLALEPTPPETCPHCHSSLWHCAQFPVKPYKLSEKDRIFLRCQRIKPDG